MHKELVGQEASLSLPCTVDATALLFGFVEELMEVSGDEASDPDALQQDIRTAVDAICAQTADEGCDVVATFAIVEDGVDLHLTCENRNNGDSATQVVAARVA